MALATIKSKNSSATTIRLDSILYGYIVGSLFTGVNKKDEANFKSLNVNQFAMYFEKNFITPIRNNKAEYLYYDNKEIDDAYQTK